MPKEMISIMINCIVFFMLVMFMVFYAVEGENKKLLLPILLISVQYSLLFGPLFKNKEMILEEKINEISKRLVLDSRDREYKKYIYHIKTEDNGYKFFQDELTFVDSEENKLEIIRYSSKIEFLNISIFTQIKTKVYTKQKYIQNLNI